MKSGSLLVFGIVLAITNAACKDDGKNGGDDLAVSTPDLKASIDLSVAFAGNGCGNAVCGGDANLCCGDDDSALACAPVCTNKVFEFRCDGTEDCATGEVCCLTIDNPNTPSHRFKGECKTAADCTATLNPAANPIVTARCHANAECASYNSILSQCCHNAAEPNVEFCAIPFSTDGGISVSCQN